MQFVAVHCCGLRHSSYPRICGIFSLSDSSNTSMILCLLL